MWSNVHTHSTFCDGVNTPEEIVQHSASLISLGFSSHAPLPFPCGWSMAEGQLDEYLGSIEKLKQENQYLQIYSGLEVDFIPDQTGPAKFSSRVDFTIGSIHFVEQLSDGRHWEVDGSRLQFNEGLEEIFNGDVKEAVTRYFELTREMIEKSPPTIVGHLDKIKIQNAVRSHFREEDRWYQDQVIKTLDAIAKSPCIVEVNTRGLYQGKSVTSYPSPWILDLILRRNIPVVLNSDAHRAVDITRCFAQTAASLRQFGFNRMSLLIDNEWKSAKFNSDGFVLE